MEQQVPVIENRFCCHGSCRLIPLYQVNAQRNEQMNLRQLFKLLTHWETKAESKSVRSGQVYVSNTLFFWSWRFITAITDVRQPLVAFRYPLILLRSISVRSIHDRFL